MVYAIMPTNTDIQHHGILGMKWGVRRYQNADGSYTAAGRKRYNKTEKKYDKKIAKNEKEKEYIMSSREKNRQKIANKYDKKINKLQAVIDNYNLIKIGALTNNLKKFMKLKMELNSDEADAALTTFGRDILTKDDVKSITNALKEKQKSLKEIKNVKLKNFDAGSRYVKKAYDVYSKTLSDYKNATLKSYSDSNYKSSDKYKDTRGAYYKQMILDLIYGSSGTTLGYAYDIANKASNKDHRNKFMYTSQRK